MEFNYHGGYHEMYVGEIVKVLAEEQESFRIKLDAKSAPLNQEKGWRIPALFHYDSLSHFLNSSKFILPSAHSSRLPFAVVLHA